MRVPQLRAARRAGFTLIELLVVVAIIALLISILLPSLARAREMAKRTGCAANLNGLGKSSLTYAESFKGSLPSMWHNEAATAATISGSACKVGEQRDKVDGGLTPGASLGLGNAFVNGQTSTPRAYFRLLVGGRRAYMQARQFICQSAQGVLKHRQQGPDVTFDPTGTGSERSLYDFSGQRILSTGEMSDFSYSFQVATKNTNAAGEVQGIILTNTQDPRKVIAADRNPYSNKITPRFATNTGDNQPLTVASSGPGAYGQYFFATGAIPDFPDPPSTGTDAQYMALLRTRTANSRNHKLEGQNVLRLDGSAKWQVMSKVGADDDCIWTTLKDGGNGTPVADLAPPVGSTTGYGGQRSRSNWLTDSLLIP